MSKKSSVSICFIKCLLFLRMSQNYKTIFDKTLLENLACFAIKVFNTFRKNACLSVIDINLYEKMLINIMINHLRSFLLTVP